MTAICGHITATGTRPTTQLEIGAEEEACRIAGCHRRVCGTIHSSGWHGYCASQSGKCGQKMCSTSAIRRISTKSEKRRNVDNSRYRCCFASVDVVRATRTAGLNENVSWECLRRCAYNQVEIPHPSNIGRSPPPSTVTGLGSGASSLTRTCRRRNEVSRKVARLEAAENSRSGEDADLTNPANPMNATNPVRIPQRPQIARILRIP